MGATTPDEIYVAEKGVGVLDAFAHFGTLASSIQRAFARRQGYTFRWADSGARQAQKGMRVGDEAFQRDNKITYKFDGIMWKRWHTIAPVLFTPTWTNLTVGNGTQVASYTLVGGRVSVTGFLKIGSTSAIGVGPYLTAPLPLNKYIDDAPNIGGDRGLGIATFVKAGVQAYPGVSNTINVDGTIFVRLQAFEIVGGFVGSRSIAGAVPLGFFVGDYITYDYSYMAD